MPTFDCPTHVGCSPAPSNSFQVIGLGQFDVGAYTNAPIVDIASGVAGRYGGDHVDLCGCKSHGPKVGAHRNPDVFEHVVVFLNGGRVGTMSAVILVASPVLVLAQKNSVKERVMKYGSLAVLLISTLWFIQRNG